MSDINVPPLSGMGLIGKAIVVTGAASGIGRATALALAQAGAKVIAMDCDEASLEALACQDPKLSTVLVDLDIEATVVKAFNTAQHLSGGFLWGLVNNAARFIMKGLEAGSADWHAVLQTNVIAPAQCARLATEIMDPAAGGAIVNVCSISSLIAQPEFLTYSASKGALLTMTKCMALDLASRHIRVNAVSPGSIWTDSNERFIAKHRHLDRRGADQASDLGGRHVLHRMGDPHEVANAAAFLLSPLASFITGANLLVDGGYTVV